MLLPVGNDLSPNLRAAFVLPVPLQQTHHGDLADHRPALRDAEALALRRVHVASRAADESLVGFDFAVSVQFPAVLSLPREPQTRENEPRGLLGDAERAAEFVAADAVLAVGEQPERGQPLFQTDWRVFENGPDLERELRLGVLGVALPSPLTFKVGHMVGAASRAANDAIGPADGFDGLTTMLVISEPENGLLKGLGCAVSCQAPNIGKSERLVKYIISSPSNLRIRFRPHIRLDSY